MLYVHNEHTVGDRVYIVRRQDGEARVRVGIVTKVSVLFGADNRQEVGYSVQCEHGMEYVNQGSSLLAAGGAYAAESLGRAIRDLLIPPPVKAPEPAPADAPAPDGDTPEGEEVPF